MRDPIWKLICQNLSLLKGAKLAVLVDIYAHSTNGCASPSVKTLATETGYNVHTIFEALAELCQLTIQGQRVLLRYQPQGEGGFLQNRYLLCPTAEEIAQHERTQP